MYRLDIGSVSSFCEVAMLEAIGTNGGTENTKAENNWNMRIYRNQTGKREEETSVNMSQAISSWDISTNKEPRCFPQ